MANNETETKLMTCFVKKADASVKVTATLSHPKAGGWSVFLDGTFVKGGHDPEAVSLGSGASVIGKMVEVSATMKNVKSGVASMSLKVDGPGTSDKIENDINPGRAAHDSMFVAFLEAP